MLATIKFGDARPIDFYTGIDMTAASQITIRARAISGGAPFELPYEAVDLTVGHIRHVTSGTLPVGAYYAEVEAVIDGFPVTFPSTLEPEMFEIVPNVGYDAEVGPPPEANTYLSKVAGLFGDVTAEQLLAALDPQLRNTIAEVVDVAVPSNPAVSPVGLANIEAPEFARQPSMLVQHSTSGMPSIYWPNIYSTAHIEGAPGLWAMTLTTDHDAAGTPEPFNGKGGVCQYYADDIMGPWTQVRSAGAPVLYQDTVAGDQTETATTVYNEASEISLGGALAVASNGTVTLNAHRMPNGQLVRVTAKTGADSISYRDYYVVERTTNTFKLALTKGGAAVSAGTTGTLAVTAVGAFHHYYQQQGVGVNQSTLLARSYTGHISDWVRYGIVIQGDALRPGDGQSTYTQVHRLAGSTWVATHLFGGGDYALFGVSWSRDGVNWRMDPRRITMKDFSTDPGRKVVPSQAVLFRWRGQLWGLSRWSAYTSGFFTGDRPWALLRPSPDLRRMEAPPLPIAVELATGETESLQPTSIVSVAGKLYAIYRSNGPYGSVRVAVAEA